MDMVAVKQRGRKRSPELIALAEEYAANRSVWKSLSEFAAANGVNDETLRLAVKALGLPAVLPTSEPVATPRLGRGLSAAGAAGLAQWQAILDGTAPRRTLKAVALGVGISAEGLRQLAVGRGLPTSSRDLPDANLRQERDQLIADWREVAEGRAPFQYLRSFLVGRPFSLITARGILEDAGLAVEMKSRRPELADQAEALDEWRGIIASGAPTVTLSRFIVQRSLPKTSFRKLVQAAGLRTVPAVSVRTKSVAADIEAADLQWAAVCAGTAPEEGMDSIARRHRVHRNPMRNHAHLAGLPLTLKQLKAWRAAGWTPEASPAQGADTNGRSRSQRGLMLQHARVAGLAA